MKLTWKLGALFLSGTLLVGCGGDGGGDSDSSSGDDTSASDTGGSGDDLGEASDGLDDDGEAGSGASIDPLIKDLVDDFEDLPNEYAEIKSAYQKDSKNVEAVQSYAATLLNFAMLHAQKGNEALSNQSLTLAAKAIQKAETAGVEFPQSDLRPTIHYGYACLQAKAGKNTEALALLNKAIETGFNNMALLEAEADLKAVRELPEYTAQKEQWTAHFEEMQKRQQEEQKLHAKEDLGKDNGYPFDFALKDVYGKDIVLEQFKGRVCIVDIWATWCGPCRQEVPSFIKLQDKYSKYGFQVIGLNSEQGSTEESRAGIVKNFMANNSMNYPCALITEEVLAQVPNLQGFPTTLYIDHKGKVRLSSVGYHDYTYMSTVVEELLKEQAAERLAARQKANTN